MDFNLIFDMMQKSNFENLQVWQESTALVLELYKLLKDCKDVNMKDQLQSLIVSIASEIDQAFDRQDHQEMIRLLHTALRSCTELKLQLNVAKDHLLFTEDVADALVEKTRQVSALLYRVIHYKKTVTHPLFNPLKRNVSYFNVSSL